MINIRKKIKYIIIVMSVIVIATGSILILTAINANNKSGSKITSNTSIKSNADALNKQASEAFKNNNIAQAKTLLEKAQAQYKLINDTNGIVDTAGQLSIISKTVVTPKTITETLQTTKQ